MHTFNLLQDFLHFMLTAITVYIDFKNTSLQEQATNHTDTATSIRIKIATLTFLSQNQTRKTRNQHWNYTKIKTLSQRKKSISVKSTQNMSDWEREKRHWKSWVPKQEKILNAHAIQPISLSHTHTHREQIHKHELTIYQEKCACKRKESRYLDLQELVFTHFAAPSKHKQHKLQTG